MKKYVLALTTAITLVTTAVSAKVYDFNFSTYDSNLVASGKLNVTDNKVDWIHGSVVGINNYSELGTQTINSVVNNTNFPYQNTSPDGKWYYDNVINVNSSPVFNNNGLLFTTTQDPTGFWNLYTVGTTYRLGESVNGTYGILGQGAVPGSFSLAAAAPELSSWIMFFIGFCALGLMGKNRNSRVSLTN